MAGAIASESHGKRRALDSEINMIPMIDLMMVTVSFLLLTAVWTHFTRIDADAMTPATPGATPPPAEKLHVELNDPARIVVHWNLGQSVIRSAEIPRHDVVTVDGSARTVRMPELAALLDREWLADGTHRDASDSAFDDVVLHTSNETTYAVLIGAIDAARSVKKPCGGGRSCPAFHVTFAAD